MTRRDASPAKTKIGKATLEPPAPDAGGLTRDPMSGPLERE
jgi:hypothetical protein